MPKLLINDLDNVIHDVIAKVKAGVLSIRQEGILVTALPNRVDFQVELIHGLNAIDRTQVTDGATITRTIVEPPVTTTELRGSATNTESESAVEARTDTQAESGVEAASDSRSSSQSESSEEESSDTRGSTQAESGVEAASDSRSSSQSESGGEANSEAGTDNSSRTSSETGTESGGEGGTDTESSSQTTSGNDNRSYTRNYAYNEV